MNEVSIKNNVIFIDDIDLSIEALNSLAIFENRIFKESIIRTFDYNIMDNKLDEYLKIIISKIHNLRKDEKHEEAIDFSDALFQSFTPIMYYFIQQHNYSVVNDMWEWIIFKIKKIEKKKGITFGNHIMLGSAYHFLGYTKLMMGDIDSAIMSYSEAARESSIFPENILKRHPEGLPPSQKLLYLNPNSKNFSHDAVKEVVDTIIKWEKEKSSIARDISIFSSIDNARKKGIINYEIAINISYGFYKVVNMSKWFDNFIEKTSIEIDLAGRSILLLIRTIEEIIRKQKGLGKNDSVFNVIHDTWFSGDDWKKVPSYENDIDNLINDFL